MFCFIVYFMIIWIKIECRLSCLYFIVQVLIYVNKKIVAIDVIRIVYGMGRVRDVKFIYDVLLDRYLMFYDVLLVVNCMYFQVMSCVMKWNFVCSFMDGLDLLVEEFNFVQNMKLVVKEERYNDVGE